MANNIFGLSASDVAFQRSINRRVEQLLRRNPRGRDNGAALAVIAQSIGAVPSQQEGEFKILWQDDFMESPDTRMARNICEEELPQSTRVLLVWIAQKRTDGFWGAIPCGSSEPGVDPDQTTCDNVQGGVMPGIIEATPSGWNWDPSDNETYYSMSGPLPAQWASELDINTKFDLTNTIQVGGESGGEPYEQNVGGGGCGRGYIEYRTITSHVMDNGETINAARIYLEVVARRELGPSYQWDCMVWVALGNMQGDPLVSGNFDWYSFNGWPIGGTAYWLDSMQERVRHQTVLQGNLLPIVPTVITDETQELPNPFGSPPNPWFGPAGPKAIALAFASTGVQPGEDPFPPGGVVQTPQFTTAVDAAIDVANNPDNYPHGKIVTVTDDGSYTGQFMVVEEENG